MLLGRCVGCSCVGSFIATIGDKMSWDTSPKTGLFYVFFTSKGGNIAFLPHPLRAMLCPCSSYLESNKHPNFEWRGQGRVRIRLFSEVTLFVSTILSPIVVGTTRSRLDKDSMRKHCWLGQSGQFFPHINARKSWLGWEVDLLSGTAFLHPWVPNSLLAVTFEIYRKMM